MIARSPNGTSSAVRLGELMGIRVSLVCVHAETRASGVPHGELTETGKMEKALIFTGQPEEPAGTIDGEAERWSSAGTRGGESMVRLPRRVWGRSRS